ncbi:MAG: endonuclease domain-containing protein [Prevotellaceae bacterium]|jgi:very-short-patch-repair endonuclease|nr:endonuclease domain-containing protein [Prevotellaceae bacterium]
MKYLQNNNILSQPPKSAKSSASNPHPLSKLERGQGGEDIKTVETNLPRYLLEYAREQRKSQTTAEELLWQVLRNKKVNQLKFRRQHPLKVGFILDFYCAEIKLGIEIDGGYHSEKEQQERDAERTKIINQYEIRIIRFTNDEVLNNIEKVLKTIIFYSLTQNLQN